MSSFSDKIAAAADVLAAASIPALLKNHSLVQLINWYEENLSRQNLLDPRKHQVVFDLSRFAYLIKLNNVDGSRLVKPLQAVEDMKAGVRCEADFGAPDQDRAERLSWLSLIVQDPLSIHENDSKLIPADEVYTRRFSKSYPQFKLLYCVRMGESMLVPVTSFRKNTEPKGKLLWHK